jgi:hypothetical protein
MKMPRLRIRFSAFTILELVIVLVIIVVAVGLLLPALAGSHKGARINCVSNLKQMGLAFRMWSNDHAEKFPMAVSTTGGGSIEYIGAGPLHHFLAISNELNRPKVLACPSDKKKSLVADFARLTHKNISYFVGLGASETEPQSILSGDRNLSLNGVLASGIFSPTGNSPVSWTKDIHKYAGDIDLGGGSAQQASTTNLQTQLGRSPNFPLRLEIP